MSGYTEPHWAASGLVVIDMQVDFAEGGMLPVAGTDAVTPNVRRLAEGFRRAGRPIVHIVRLYPPGSSDVDLPRRAAVEAGAVLGAPDTPGSAVIAGIAGPGGPLPVDAGVLLAGKPQVLGEHEIVLFKPRWGAFYRTELEQWLRERQVDTVVVAGCNLPNCPRATLFEASERDFRTVLVEDAVSQVSAERLADLAGIGVTLSSTGTVLAEVAGPPVTG
ncbi:cysteine hydrolase family protein [Actinoplanes aureus]|uniref:Cysteine hydrolase n=1 Tax=Actinoplanes aureus TaxID=2792083 RepID=A0A931G1R8_9ACTN|nr:isochorismatase family cysteine hydrolase [Actinoplanes aureus]MBG0567315.1 cysteine hydrolase [Actinoplanes aureus]